MSAVEKLCRELEGEIKLTWPSGKEVRTTPAEGALWRLIGKHLREAIEADRREEGYGDPRWFAYTERQWAFFSSPEAADLWLGAAEGGIRGPFYPGPAYSEARQVPADTPEETS